MMLDLIKVISPAAVSFAVGILLTPLLTHFLYKYRLWKKTSVAFTADGHATPISQKLHNDENLQVPRMGGIIIWASSLITIGLFWLWATLSPSELSLKLNFLSRNQTWLTVFTLFVGAFIGLIDDYLTVYEKGDRAAGGMSIFKRVFIVGLVGLIGGWWFFYKLDVSAIAVPFIGFWDIGIFFIPFFIIVMLSTYSGGIIDGIDGLAGGVFAIIFSAYGTIAFFQGQIDLAAFAFVVVGALLAFLWFNIPPARFYMSETGIMAVTLTLTVMAFMTRQVLVLPIIAFPLVISTGSTIVQMFSRKFLGGKKVFIVAPLHHHLEAQGWPSHKVTMRYWVLSAILAVVGILIAFLGS